MLYFVSHDDDEVAFEKPVTREKLCEWHVTQQLDLLLVASLWRPLRSIECVWREMARGGRLARRGGRSGVVATYQRKQLYQYMCSINKCCHHQNHLEISINAVSNAFSITCLHVAVWLYSAEIYANGSVYVIKAGNKIIKKASSTINVLS